MLKNQIDTNSRDLLEKLAQLTEPELSDLVRFHNKKYFDDNDPIISDEAFDKLVEALRFINPKAQALEEIGHGSAHEQFGNEVEHLRPMLSLEKCYDDATFFKWAEKIACDFVAMPKIDGAACSLIYDVNGRLIEASTRGDGKSGEDITKNVLLIPDVPSVLSKSKVSAMIDGEFLEIRGEVFLPISEFKAQFADTFVNPRNLAAGFLKLKERERQKSSHLKFFPYDVRGTKAVSEREKFNSLQDLGFSMMPWQAVLNDSDATNIYQELLKKREDFDFETDGVVFRADLLKEQTRLGETAHHPRYALAYKFQGESAQTKLVGVEWSVARSGIITPVALVAPVFVSGASITRASLHNLGIFLALDLREQSLVEINRRGGVIPYLERVLSKSGPALGIPTRCPSCQGDVVIEADFLHCKQPENCEEVTVAKLVHFCHVLNMEGMGDKIVRKLFRAGLLHNYGDIFRLTASSLLNLERMGEILANKLIAEIHSKRIIDLATFIRALGIHEIGANISGLLAYNFHSLPKILSLTEEELLPIHGIGESIAHALVTGLHELADEIQDLLTEVTVLQEQANQEVDKSHALFGKSVLFTGKMAHLERKSAQNAVKKLGGHAPGAMSNNVDYLVIGDDGSALLGAGKKSTKHKEAEKLIAAGGKIKIISENEFLTMLG